MVRYLKGWHIKLVQVRIEGKGKIVALGNKRLNINYRFMMGCKLWSSA